MQQSPITYQEITHLSRKPFSQDSATSPILRQMNPVHSLQLYLTEI
jgi:hypothetical protein